jgi:hypothetical protein
MKKILPYNNLSQREVPASLDARILAYGSRRCRAAKFRRRLVWWGSVAAAVCLMAAGGIFFQMEQPVKGSKAELLALGDFSNLDQSSYNISFELACNGDFSQF